MTTRFSRELTGTVRYLEPSRTSVPGGAADAAPSTSAVSDDVDRTIQGVDHTGPSSDDLPAEVLSADEVAAFLKVDRKTVYDYAARGEIPCRRLGRRLLFSRSALVSWLTECKVASRAHGA
jgi:excisionase family DNA binding protein